MNDKSRNRRHKNDRSKRAAQEVQQARQRRTADQQWWERRFGELDTAQEATDTLVEVSKLMMRVVLVAQGCYLHKGHEWRKRGKKYHV